MLFGFVMAAVGGFLLTAIPNWTDRPPVAGSMLAVLVALWLLGRLARLFSAIMPGWLALLADLASPSHSKLSPRASCSPPATSGTTLCSHR
jgi:uncharacterized protein involved in response to NO